MLIRFRDGDGKLRTVETKKLTVMGATRCEASEERWVFIDEHV